MAKRKKLNEDEPENQDNLNNDADDTFGLPEVQYEPIRRDDEVTEEPEERRVEETEPTEEPVRETEPVYEKQEDVIERYEPPVQYNEEDQHEGYRPADVEEESSSVWPRVLIVVLLLLVAGGAGYYFGFYRPAEKRKQEEIARVARENAEKEEAARREKERLEQLAREAAQRKADSLARIPTEGSLERLTDRTGQYYVVVASNIDVDLLTDFANRLVKEGKQVKLIPPFGKAKFHRLAIEARDTYADAQAVADSMKGGELGEQLWVLRY